MRAWQIIAVLLFAAPGIAPAQQADPYTSSTTGNAYSAAGAEIRVKATTASPGASRVVDTRIRADSVHLHRIFLSADVDAKDVTGRTNLYLSASDGTGVLIQDDGAGKSVTGTRTVHVELSLVVPASATTLNAGIELRGNGDVIARKLRITFGPRITAATAPAPAAKRLLDSAISIVRTHSLMHDSAVSPTIEKEIRRVAAGAQTDAEIRRIVKTFLSRIGDSKGSYFLIPARPDAPPGSPPLTSIPVIGFLPAPQVWTEEKDVGSIAMQALSFATVNDRDQYASKTYTQLMDRSVSGSCRWIIDLRNTFGDDVWPALAALQPFLGSADIGAFVDAGGNETPWHAGDNVSANVPSALNRLQRANVAILIGQGTSEAAENVAIAFRGRENTRTFGSASAGAPGLMESFIMPDGGLLRFTTRASRDRKGARITGPLEPDISAAAGVDADIRTAAVAWLKQQRCH